MNKLIQSRIILFVKILVAIVALIPLRAQSITFERLFTNLDEPNVVGLKLLELNDGNYLIAGSRSNDPLYYNFYDDWSNLILLKTDMYGYNIWQKEIQTVQSQFRPSNQVLLTDQNEILVLSIKNIQNVNTLNISKFDFDGNEIIETNLLADSTLRGCAINSLGNDGYLIAACNDDNQFNMRIIRLDNSFNNLWEKNINFFYPSLYHGSLSITKWGNDGYAIGFKSRIIKISSVGDSLFSISNAHSFITDTKDGDILVSGSELTRLDPNGIDVWSYDFEKDLGPVIQSEDGNYIVVIHNTDYNNPYSIQKMNDIGNIIWTKNILGQSFSILETINYSLLLTGKWYYYYDALWMLKTDSSGEYTAINILSPVGGEELLTFNFYEIRWYSSNVEKVNIYYSTSEGIDWNIIVSNVNADTGVYNWSVPLLFADSIKIKIEDSNNPDIFSLTEYPIYISVYQPTDYLSVNEIFMWIGNNGMGSHDPRTDASGFFWSGGDSATIAAIFNDGLVWGGKVNGEIRVNGNTYRAGLQPGKILEEGTADNPLSTQSKIFKIRKDWQSLPEGIFKQRLEYDYNHWPIEAGAPWDDVNEDGVYTPGFDKPKFIGDETLFYVANDLDTATSKFTYGSDPIGLEFQTTVFGFNREDLKDVVFKKYRVINKSNSDIEDMYFTYWTDDDMGYANDDYEGFDSTYNMGYSFNGDNDDEGYYGTPPPAVGHMIVQGPIIQATIEDSALFNNGWKIGFRNLRMTSSGMIMKWGGYYWPGDPDLGVYEGTLQFYNMMQGLSMNGSQLINPITGEPTIWPLSGDPVSGIGWYEGEGWPGGDSPGDHRYHVPTGPFNLAAGDTQEIVIAIPIARGTDNINSITKLRELAAHVQEFYNTEFVELLNTKETIAPSGYTLFQNYPNPFNPKTTIEYEVPEKSNVTIKIYDILGREIKTLVDNEEKVRWKYKVEFDATNFASGVYFYRMQVNPVSGAGSFTQTKKMVVLK